jgi:hypothetical protein
MIPWSRNRIPVGPDLRPVSVFVHIIMLRVLRIDIHVETSPIINLWLLEMLVNSVSECENEIPVSC